MRCAECVPLNSKCSRKCAAPCWPGPSCREPAAIQTPKVAERVPGISSVRTRTPEGSSVRRTTEPSAVAGNKSVLPASCSVTGW